ncbi:unnamed protein product, partial [Ectocarpus fasciculatus]
GQRRRRHPRGHHAEQEVRPQPVSRRRDDHEALPVARGEPAVRGHGRSSDLVRVLRVQSEAGDGARERRPRFLHQVSHLLPGVQADMPGQPVGRQGDGEPREEGHARLVAFAVA